MNTFSGRATKAERAALAEKAQVQIALGGGGQGLRGLGLGFGLVQMVRGAHYFSHVLWAGWVCWVAGGLFWLAMQALRRRRARG